MLQMEFEKNHNTIGYYFMAKISRFIDKIGDAITYVNRGLELQPNNFRLIEFAEDLEKLCAKRKKFWF